MQSPRLVAASACAPARAASHTLILSQGALHTTADLEGTADPATCAKASDGSPRMKLCHACLAKSQHGPEPARAKGAGGVEAAPRCGGARPASFFRSFVLNRTQHTTAPGFRPSEEGCACPASRPANAGRGASCLSVWRKRALIPREEMQRAGDECVVSCRPARELARW